MVPGLLVAALLLLASSAALALRDGDYIHTGRKAQFHATRTNWHDLLGHHCPRFGMERLVAVPLPKPQLTLQDTDEYKMQLSFDGDRHLTQWLTLTGKKAPEVPLVQVQLTRSGEEILGVYAEVEDAPSHYKERHALLVEEFKNATHWPKHVLVHYTWVTENDVDLDRGLYVIFAFGLLAALLLAFNSVRGLESKLKQFLSDMTGDDPLAPAVWKGAKEG